MGAFRTAHNENHFGRLKVRLRPDASLQMLDVLFVFFADIFQNTAVRDQALGEPDGERFRVQLRIVHRDFDVQMAEIASPEALHHMESVAVPVANGVEPGFVVEAYRIDYECVALPLAGRVT